MLRNFLVEVSLLLRQKSSFYLNFKCIVKKLPFVIQLSYLFVIFEKGVSPNKL